ncbi:MAG: AMP-dependent synthetase/ligase [Spirochaetia bacterium]
MEYSNFRELIDDVCDRYPQNIAFRMRRGNGAFDELEFAEVKKRVHRYAAALTALGMHKGDRLGLISENRIEWTLTYLSAVYNGIVVVPFDIHTSQQGLAVYAEFADLKGIAFSEKYSQQAREMSGTAPDCSLQIHFDRESFEAQEKTSGSSAHFLADMLSTEPAAAADELPPLERQDPAAIIFTSGTTGNPKGVTLSHYGIIANSNASKASLPIDEHDNFVAVLPFHHTYPTTCSFVSPFSVGGAVTIVEKIIGQKIIADIRDSRGSIIIGVPLLFDKLKKGIGGKLEQLPPVKRNLIRLMRSISRMGLKLGLPLGRGLFKGLREKAGLNSLRLLVSGGGPLAHTTALFFEELGFKIVQGYGMSENGPLITTNTEKRCDNRSAGLPVVNTDIRIADKDNAGIGEIQVTSPSLMLGYFRNPEATKAAFTADGYLKTGDLGYFDRRGFLFINGRSKNMIVTSGGKNVFPEEIEVLFPEGGPIAEVLIMGQELKNSRGERVIAVCVPDYEGLKEVNGGRLPTATEIEQMIKTEIAKVNRRLESHQKIERTYIRSEPFEKTASDKIKRFLYKQYAQPEE